MAQPKDKLHKNQHYSWRPDRLALRYWQGSRWHKVVSIVGLLFLLCLCGMYGIARWYQQSIKDQSTSYGVSFIADYASYLGVDPHQTLNAIINDLHPKQLRLVSYWSDIESTQGTYNFSELDYEMSQAQAHGIKVTLSIGLRQPRWPECHAPSWVDTTKPTSSWQPQLNAFMTAVVNRYKDTAALESYQLENEYFNHFGACYNFDRDRLRSEFSMVKKLDAKHPIVISRSNNWAGLAVGDPTPDESGISVYRHVWDGMFTHNYITYPFPSWYYAFLAGAEKILTGKPSILHELQAEPWPPEGKGIKDISLSEQNKSFNAATLQGTVKFADQTGLKQIDLWGAEYWYYRMQVEHDSSVWNGAKTIFND